MKPGFRADIEGLRAVAILAILLKHAELGIAKGGFAGVEVFFVVSGFVITRLLFAEMDRTGTISLRDFYARRVKRLLPMAATGLIAVAVLSAILFSPVRAELVAGDIVAAAAYVVNWRFAEQSVNYFAGGHEVSPVQHLWTLSVEEQFYVVWPLVLVGVAWFWARGWSNLRTTVTTTAIVIGLASLAYNFWYTPQEPAAAYFSTPARAWEMALGAALAVIVLPRIPRPVKSLLAYGGAAAIVYAIVAYDGETPYPGYAALVPALGTAAIIAAGSREVNTWPGRILSLRPVRYVGQISYPWYIWHWPFLVFAAALWGSVSAVGATAAVLASLVPTIITHHWIEEPFRRSKSLRAHPRRAMALGGACTAAAACAAVAVAVSQPTIPVAPASEVRGATVLDNGGAPARKADEVRPNPRKVREDRTRLQEDGCLVRPGGTESGECVYGDPSSGTTVVLIGDSHANQFFPAVEAVAKRREWRLVALAKVGCMPVAVQLWSWEFKRQYTECETWRRHALERVEAEEPDLVLATGFTATKPVRDGKVVHGDEGKRIMEDAYVEVLTRLHDASSRVMAIKDPPRTTDDVPSCVSENRDRLEECAFRKSDNHGNAFDARAVRRVDGVKLLDLTPTICPKGVCWPVVGNALVFRDTNHLTPSYARTLAPRIEEQIPRLD